MRDAELTLAEFLDSKWATRIARAVWIVLGLFVPVGGITIGYMVNDSRAKAAVAELAVGDMLNTVSEIKSATTRMQISISGLQSDLSLVKLSAARTAGIVEQMQLQMRPAAASPPLPFRWAPALAEVR